MVLIEAVMNNSPLFLKLLSDLFSPFEVDFANVTEQIFVLFDKWIIGQNLGDSSLLCYGRIKSFRLLIWTLDIWLNILFDLAAFLSIWCWWLFRAKLLFSGIYTLGFKWTLIVFFTFVIFALSVTYISLVIIKNFLRLSELALGFLEIRVFVN